MISGRIFVKVQTSKRPVSAKASWRVIGGRRIYFRSGWEVKVALYLQMLLEGLKIRNWEHEPRTFWFEEIKRGVRSYKPDFKITQLDGTHYWVEVKGYMDKKSATKIKRFKKYYPNEELVVLDAKWFARNLPLLPK
jgi:hypothetical protein